MLPSREQLIRAGLLPYGDGEETAVRMEKRTM